MKAFKKWGKKIKGKKKKKCLRTQKLLEKFLQSLLRNSIPNKTTEYINKQTKHRPKYILCLIKLCEMGNVLKPEFDQYT